MLLVQSILQLVMLTGPGLLFWIWRTQRREASSNGPWCAMGISYLAVSVLLVCLEGTILPNLQAIGAGLPLRIAAGVLNTLILLLIAAVLFKNRAVREQIARSLPFEVSASIAVYFIISLTFAELPGVPGSGHFALADVAFYAAATADRVENRFDHPSLWLADYLGGSLAYLHSHPLPVFAVTALSRLFGTPPLHAQNQFNLLPINLCLFIIGAALSRIDRKVAFWANLLILCAPATAILSTNAAHVLPATLGFLFLSFSITNQLQWSRAFRFAMASLSGFFLILHRPESAVFALTVAVSSLLIGLLVFLSRWKYKIPAYLIVGATLLIIPNMTPIKAERILERLSNKYLQSLSISYVYWSPDDACFTTVKYWQSINGELTKGNLIEGYKNKLINPAIARQIFDHPIEFIQYCVLQFWRGGLRACCYVFGIEVLLPLGNLTKVFFTVVLALGLVTPPFSVLSLSVLLALAALSLANFGIEFRHTYLMLPSLVFYLSTVCSSTGFSSVVASSRIIRRYNFVFWAGSAFILFALPVYYLSYYIRMDGSWLYHRRAVEILEKYVPPGGVVGAAIPQVVSSISSFRVVGGSGLGKYLRFVERRFCPDALILTNRVNMQELRQSRQFNSRTLGRYSMIMRSSSPKFLILRRRVRCLRQARQQLG